MTNGVSAGLVTLYGKQVAVPIWEMFTFVARATATGQPEQYYCTQIVGHAWEWVHQKIDVTGGTGTVEVWEVLDRNNPTLRRSLGTVNVPSPNAAQEASHV
jgi:hypothetical protein